LDPRNPLRDAPATVWDLQTETAKAAEEEVGLEGYHDRLSNPEDPIPSQRTLRKSVSWDGERDQGVVRLGTKVATLTSGCQMVAVRGSRSTYRKPARDCHGGRRDRECWNQGRGMKAG